MNAAQAGGGLGGFLGSIPPITRAFALATLACTFGSHLGFVDLRLLAMSWWHVRKNEQVRTWALGARRPIETRQLAKVIEQRSRVVTEVAATRPGGSDATWRQRRDSSAPLPSAALCLPATGRSGGCSPATRSCPLECRF